MSTQLIKDIHCCGCDKTVTAKLTSGGEMYPHRPDLKSLPFWKCPHCLNFVGCHHKTKQRTRPLGCIPTPEIKAARQHIHRILDPLWANDKSKRGPLYAEISERMGKQYHTAEIRSVEEARKVYAIVKDLAK
mgnify:CR=1 FL=1